MTTGGEVEGRERSGALLFAGIPFAAPPIGERRFGPPESPEPWSGVRSAQRFGPAAPQPTGEPGSLMGAGPKSVDEDCLTLNVCTPACDQAGRAVMVWIHGGAFRTGTGAIPWYDGASFATNHDVVTVTINYRLGALGFMELDDRPGSGVNGLLDQVAALEWVRDNIANFGGDPSRVTVAGESAGAMAIGALLGMPASAGLYRAAIAQSGAARHVVSSDNGAIVAKTFLAELDADPYDASWSEIISAQTRTEAALAQDETLGTMPFAPVVGSAHLPGMPLEAVAGGSSSDVNLLIGTNLDECSLWGVGKTDEERMIRKLSDMIGDGERAAAVYRARLGADASPAAVLLAARTDETFRAPAARLAEAHQGNTWSYLFRWASRVKGLGSTHALEIPFTFNTLDRPGVEFFLGEGIIPTTLASRMHASWAEFVKTGDPGWAPYDAASGRQTMEFDQPGADDTSALVADPLAEERLLWSAS